MNFIAKVEAKYTVAKFGGSARLSPVRIEILKEKLQDQGYGVERVQDRWWLTRQGRHYLQLGLQGHAKLADVLEKALKIVQPKVAASAAPKEESQKLGKKSLTSFNLDIMTKIVKGLPQFHFSKMNYTASGIEGEFLYRQPDGKAGRYHMEIKKVGMT